MLPKVSIIIYYNKDRGWLNEAIESVKNQSYQGEIEIIESVSDKGASYNLNRGIERATGDYIKYLSEDDRLTPWSIEESVEAMEGNDFIHGSAINFFENGSKNYYTPDSSNPHILDMIARNRIHGGTLMYRRDVFDRVGLFDETLDCAEEYEFNLRCLDAGLKLGYCDSFLYEYRRHSEQKSLGNVSEEYQNIRKEKIKKIQDKYESRYWDRNLLQAQ